MPALSPKAFAGQIVQPAFLKLTETATATDDRFDRDKINQVVASTGKDRITDSDETARFIRTKAPRRNRPEQATTDAPERLVRVQPGANRVCRESRQGLSQQHCDDYEAGDH